MTAAHSDVLAAITHALEARWDAAHELAQRHDGNTHADWLHAILHKIEGDEVNARYWYRRAGQSYEAWSDAAAELRALQAVLTY